MTKIQLMTKFAVLFMGIVVLISCQNASAYPTDRADTLKPDVVSDERECGFTDADIYNDTIAFIDLNYFSESEKTFTDINSAHIELLGGCTHAVSSSFEIQEEEKILVVYFRVRTMGFIDQGRLFSDIEYNYIFK